MWKAPFGEESAKSYLNLSGDCRCLAFLTGLGALEAIIECLGRDFGGKMLFST